MTTVIIRLDVQIMIESTGFKLHSSSAASSQVTSVGRIISTTSISRSQPHQEQSKTVSLYCRTS